MRCLLTILFCLTTIKNFVQAQETVTSYQVPGVVPPLKQPKDMDCWITATTMMLSWKDSVTYTIDDVVKKIGAPWNIYYETNTGLPPSEQEKFMKRVGLQQEPPASYMLKAYSSFLRSYGPIWITTGAYAAHVRILIGIEGDGSYDKTVFISLDPESGSRKSENAGKFFQKFEAEARRAIQEGWTDDLRIQIYHF